MVDMDVCCKGACACMYDRLSHSCLQLHAKDKREYIYTEEELETASTHDALWNAAQVRCAIVQFLLNLYLRTSAYVCVCVHLRANNAYVRNSRLRHSFVVKVFVVNANMF